MKKILLLSFVFILTVQWGISQSVPKGMNYQAVAHDETGNILANQKITLKILLHSSIDSEEGDYIEEHELTTNEFGLFNLIVGNGKAIAGTFDEVPWATKNIWMEVSTKSDKEQHFKVISDSRLLAVPYAYHALTAEQVVEENPYKRSGPPGIPSQTWSLFGNRKSDPDVDKLGTTDCADLVMVTNNLERLRIECEGKIVIDSDLDVGNNLDVGNDVHIGNDLTVDQNVELNVEGGSTEIHGDLTVSDQSSTNLTGTLTVDGATNLNNSLDVNNSSPTNLTGTLEVDGATTLNSSLDVTNNSPTVLTGNLTVDGTTNLNNTLDVNNSSPTNLTGTLNVDGATILNNSVDVTNNSPTKLTGTLTVDGATNLNSSLQVNNNSPTNLTGNLNVDGTTDLNNGLDVNNSTPTNLTGTLNVTGATSINGVTNINATLNANALFSAGSTVNLNTSGGATTIYGLTTINDNLIVNGDATFSKCLQSGSASQALFKFNPQVVNTNENSFGNYPLQISGNGASQGMAIKVNQWAPNHNFLAFFAGNEMRGRIEGKNNFLFNTLSSTSQDLLDYDPNEAQGEAGSSDTTSHDASGAVADAGDNPVPTNGVPVTEANTEEVVELIILAVDFIGAVVEVASSFTSIPFDPVDIFEAALGAVVSGASLGVFIGFGIANVGVAYESGSGDYAEWLEKTNIEEVMSYGDIVGVIGGKISKTYDIADHYMVVSAAPAVIGNMPQPDEEEAFETVAFIGQVPVKVRGIVNIGDYILPSGDGDGLAIAVPKDQMKARDYARIVGVAWENSKEADQNKIFQMINTAVGINQNDMSATVEQMQMVMNKMQAAIQEINPEYAGYTFATQNNQLPSNTNYSVSSTHESNMMHYFDGQAYSNREELGALVKHALETEAHIDLSKYPVIDKILLDPAYAESAKQHYSKLLDQYLQRLEDMKSGG